AFPSLSRHGVSFTSAAALRSCHCRKSSHDPPVREVRAVASTPLGADALHRLLLLLRHPTQGHKRHDRRSDPVSPSAPSTQGRPGQKRGPQWLRGICTSKGTATFRSPSTRLNG